MRVVLCDRCGAKITKGTTIGHLNAWYEDLKDLDKAKPEYNGWDFCPDCMEVIDSFIKTPLEFVTPEEAPADAEFAESLEEELDAEPDIESADEPINEPISEPADEPKDKPKKDTRGGARPGSGKKPSIDWGKFKACVDAGRDNKWLAVEFGTDVERIPKWRWLLKDKINKGQIK